MLTRGCTGLPATGQTSTHHGHQHRKADRQSQADADQTDGRKPPAGRQGLDRLGRPARRPRGAYPALGGEGVHHQLPHREPRTEGAESPHRHRPLRPSDPRGCPPPGAGAGGTRRPRGGPRPGAGRQPRHADSPGSVRGVPDGELQPQALHRGGGALRPARAAPPTGRTGAPRSSHRAGPQGASGRSFGLHTADGDIP